MSRRVSKPREVLRFPNGQAAVTFKRGERGSFLRACLITWTLRDGKDRHWMLRAKSVDVPADIVAATRERLSMDLTFAGRRASQEDIDA